MSLTRIHDTFPAKPTKQEKRAYILREMNRKRLWAIQDEGKAAFQAQIRRRGAPYPPLSPERIAWVQGWDYGYHCWAYERLKRRRLLGDYEAWPVPCPWRLLQPMRNITLQLRSLLCSLYQRGYSVFKVSYFTTDTGFTTEEVVFALRAFLDQGSIEVSQAIFCHTNPTHPHFWKVSDLLDPLPLPTSCGICSHPYPLPPPEIEIVFALKEVDRFWVTP